MSNLFLFHLSRYLIKPQEVESYWHFCFNRESGKLMWRNNAGSGYRPGEGDGFDYQLDSRSNYASPSPVTDGEQGNLFFRKWRSRFLI